MNNILWMKFICIRFNFCSFTYNYHCNFLKITVQSRGTSGWIIEGWMNAAWMLELQPSALCLPWEPPLWLNQSCQLCEPILSLTTEVQREMLLLHVSLCFSGLGSFVWCRVLYQSELQGCPTCVVSVFQCGHFLLNELFKFQSWLIILETFDNQLLCPSEK